MMTGEIKPIVTIVLTIAAVGILSLAAAYFAEISLCPVYNLVGIPCPSCGMTRAWAFALQGRAGEALAYQPMFWVVILLPFLALKRKVINIAALSILVMLIAVWAVRMLCLFPHTEPMTINDNALIFKIFNY